MWVNILVYLLTHLIASMSVSFDQSFSCYADSSNFTTNTTYSKNLDFILHSLPNNMSEHGGFFTVTVGQGSNKAYALGLCREDLTSYVCHSCVKFAVDDLRASLGEFDGKCGDKGFQRLFYSQKQGARIQNPNYWLGWDLHRFYVPNPATTAPSLSPPLAPGTPLTITKAALGLALFSACYFFLWKRINIQEDKEDTQEVQLLDLVQGSVPHKNLNGDFNLENVGRSLDFPSIHLDILQTATNNFCDENKLG
ncbi:hypothetical protein Goklo_000005 [Gossypium klotzschianum]|uniref:Gnk2-homologous domain-containing protein n=1 Tax=Gossypium klotzschianum TaxID=34286 RepID=A0A7J8WDP0_9ROSI|nr:hypothetical protein [Gossypium klotzschianum]